METAGASIFSMDGSLCDLNPQTWQTRRISFIVDLRRELNLRAWQRTTELYACIKLKPPSS